MVVMSVVLCSRYRARGLTPSGLTMRFPGAWLLVGLLLICSVLEAFAMFGDDISHHNEDSRFAVMGQVTKDTFDVNNGTVTLQLNVQDTTGTMDFWILDFEEYRFNLDRLPVDETSGTLTMSRTSGCSNVYEDADWFTFFNDSYVQDKSTSELSSKNLFTTIQRGPVDDDGVMRNNKFIFQGDMTTFFNCKDSGDEAFVWDMTSITSDEIEYRTKLYATNVRPKDSDDPTGGVSFVQSHIELIWRLSRTALAKLLISSTALIQPVLEFARVSAVYDDQNRPIPTQSALHIRFRTIVDANDHLVAYVNDSIVYIPENSNHGLNEVTYQPLGTLDTAPDCDFVLDEGTQTQIQCQQTWEFKVILDVDISTQVDNRIPVDTSGTFEFLFNAYRCALENNAINKSSCVLISDEPTKVSALITLQTIVYVYDETADQITIILHSLTGASNEDLSFGSGSRGVAHREYVDLRVKFSPALLRKDYDLFLLLFMVCKGQEYAGDDYQQGCLEAPTQDRYVAHLDTSFKYTPRTRDENGTAVILDEYNMSHVVNDYLQPLHIQEYVREENGQTLAIPVHRSTFYNVALSAESTVYTITVVFRLIEFAGRRRRAALPGIQDDVVLAKGVLGRGTPKTSSGDVTTRHVRAVKDSVRDSHSNKIPYLSLGCPKHAEHVREELDCRCPEGMVYSLKTFNCEAPTVKVLIPEDEVKDQDETIDVTEKGSAQRIVCSALFVAVTTLVVLIAIK